MKISYNWIKSLVPSLALSADELAELLTSHSFETVINGKIDIDPKVIVAKIEAIKPHPNADRLRLVTVNDGVEQIKVVCGAQNISVGDVVPFSPVGTTVLDAEGKPFKLSVAKIRGVESSGMLNSPRELGLGDSHAGIYILPADTPVGSKLSEHIPSDTILEADILPDRAHDCLNHVGIAKEVAALLDAEFIMPTAKPLPNKKLTDWTIDITEKNNVLRYIGVSLSSVKVQMSPLWIQARLWAVGARPINNIVDITNYVMFEIGTPTHAFDADKLPGKTIGVRTGKNKEKIKTLDGQERELSPNALVITSDEVPVAIAGVMGGESSEVQGNTTNIFLEVANFAAYGVHRSGASLKLFTEGSMRHSKGISPIITEQTAVRSIELFSDIAGAEMMGAYDYYPRKAEPILIKFHPERPSAIAGTDIPVSEVKNILLRLRCNIKEVDEYWEVTPPVERLDLMGEHDLVEEVVRVFGLSEIPARDSHSESVALSSTVQWRENIRDLLVEQGMTEVYNYSFDDENMLRLLGVDYSRVKRLKVLNPPAPEFAYLRTSLLPRVLANVLTNKSEFKKKFTNVERALFEVGIVFSAGEGGRVDNVVEEERIAGVWVGEQATNSKATVEKIMALLGIEPVFEGAADLPGYWAEGSMKIYSQSQQLIGYIGNLSPQTKVSSKLGQTVGMFELSLDALIKEGALRPDYKTKDVAVIKKYIAPSIYPPTYRDISIIVSSDIKVEQVQEIIERVGKELVTDVDLFDVYESVSGGERRQSLAFHIEYQSATHTLTNEEVESLHNNIVAQLRQELSAELRE